MEGHLLCDALCSFTPPDQDAVDRHLEAFPAHEHRERQRDFLLAAMPRAPSVHHPQSSAICIFCGKTKDRRSLQLDHLIPYLLYVRYKLYLDSAALTRSFGSHGTPPWRAHFEDPENLVLACGKCNRAKSDGLPDRVRDMRFGRAKPFDAAKQTLARLRRLGTPLAAAEAKVNASIETMKAIRRAAKHAPTGWMLRHGNEPLTMADRLETHATDSPVYIRRQINTAIADIIKHPSLQAGFLTVYQSQQPPDLPTEERDRRVCFLCFGIFNKQSFDIDHVKAVGRSATKEISARTMNDVDNFMPLCSHCNRSKGKHPLTAEKLHSLIRKRKTQGLPGVEEYLDARQMSEAMDRRNTLMLRAMSKTTRRDVQVGHEHTREDALEFLYPGEEDLSDILGKRTTVPIQSRKKLKVRKKDKDEAPFHFDPGDEGLM